MVSIQDLIDEFLDLEPVLASYVGSSAAGALDDVAHVPVLGKL